MITTRIIETEDLTKVYPPSIRAVDGIITFGLEKDTMNATGSVAFQQIGAWAGIIVPILFTALVIVESLLRPGYSQIYNNISDLGVGSYAIIQNANFIICGLLSLIFAFGFGRTLTASSERRARSVIGSIVVFGLGTMFAGVSLLFLAYFAHILATFTAFFTLIAAQLLTWRSLKNSDGKTWGRYRAYSLISGLLSVALLFMFCYTLSTAYHGATERMFVAVPLIWIEVTGIKLLHSPSKESIVALKMPASFSRANVSEFERADSPNDWAVSVGGDEQKRSGDPTAVDGASFSFDFRRSGIFSLIEYNYLRYIEYLAGENRFEG